MSTVYPSDEPDQQEEDPNSIIDRVIDRIIGDSDER
jgi:hypothetical protein